MRPADTPVPKMLLTMAQAGQACSLCAKSIYNAIRGGELVATHIGRSVRVTPQALAAWIDAKTGTPAPALELEATA